MSGPPPRVLIIWDEHWPRALLRAQLIEDGYDAVGAPQVGEALACPVSDPDRGTVRLIVVEHAVAVGRQAPLISVLRAKHRGAKALLLAHGYGPVPPGEWDLVLRRPIPVAQIVTTIEAMLPIGSHERGSASG